MQVAPELSIYEDVPASSALPDLKDAEFDEVLNSQLLLFSSGQVAVVAS